MLITLLFRKPAIACVALAACSLFAWTIAVSADQPDTAPNGKGIGTRQNHGNGPNGEANPHRSAGMNGISYHGGPLMTSGPNVYYIWYGDWGSDTAKKILPNLPAQLSGSPYFHINSTYYDSSNAHVQNFVNLSGQYSISPSSPLYIGSTLSDANVQSIVASVINNGRLAYDSGAVYFLLTSPEIQENSGFCAKYCGWHTHFALNGDTSSDVKYAFVGDAETQCPSSCEEQTALSPNNNPGADGMASVIAHELEEATTDPNLNAWYDNRGAENADKCAWTFGTTHTASNGSLYNVTFPNGMQFLIQQNWVNAKGGYCAMSY